MENEEGLIDNIDSFLNEILNNNLLARINCGYSASKLNGIAHKLNKLADIIQLNNVNIEHQKIDFVDLLEDTIISFGNHDFSKRIEYTTDGTVTDAIAAGINMLGDEMSKTLVSRDFFKSMFDSAKDVLIVFNNDGNIVDVNAAGLLFFDRMYYNKAESQFNTQKEDNLAEIIEITNQLIKSKDLYKFGEIEIKTRAGEKKYFDYTLVGIKDKTSNIKGYLFAGHDISGRKIKEIKEVNLLIKIQEQERKRLSEDLHDSLAQRLNGIALYLNTLKEFGDKSEEFEIYFKTCIGSVKDSLNEIRELSFNLMPRSLEHGGLIAGIEELIGRLSAQLLFEFVRPQEEPVISKEKKLHVFRIIQEFINNSIKHSKSKKISIILKSNDNLLSVILKDYGIGFDFNNEFEGNGLKNIKSRMLALEAKWKFTGSNGEGVMLDFDISY